MSFFEDIFNKGPLVAKSDPVSIFMLGTLNSIICITENFHWRMQNWFVFDRFPKFIICDVIIPARSWSKGTFFAFARGQFHFCIQWYARFPTRNFETLE